MNSPHIGHAVLFSVLSFVAAAIYSIFDRMIFLVLFIFFLLVILIIFGLLWFDKVNDNWIALSRAAEKISLLDDQRFEIFGHRFPKFRVKWGRGLKPKLLFGDCEHAEIGHFAIFMKRSTPRETAPLRYWYGEDSFRDRVYQLDRNQWYEIIQELLDQKAIIPDSAMGSHSFLWASTTLYASMRKSWSEYIQDEKQIPEIDTPIMTPQNYRHEDHDADTNEGLPYVE